MAVANGKFKPKASSNIIEGVTPADEAEVTAIQELASEDFVAEEPEKVQVVEEVPTVKFEDVVSKPAVAKNVKVCLKANHSCTIGGVRYHFEKGKQYNVPEGVKTILRQADLLMPL